ncbi:unnamed protein product [Closterium sp. Yama58-4]|nr:unnamed protein product [Closterium sp. Yama58-4]
MDRERISKGSGGWEQDGKRSKGSGDLEQEEQQAKEEEEGEKEEERYKVEGKETKEGKDKEEEAKGGNEEKEKEKSPQEGRKVSKLQRRLEDDDTDEEEECAKESAKEHGKEREKHRKVGSQGEDLRRICADEMQGSGRRGSGRRGSGRKAGAAETGSARTEVGSNRKSRLGEVGRQDGGKMEDEGERDGERKRRGKEDKVKETKEKEGGKKGRSKGSGRREKAEIPLKATRVFADSSTDWNADPSAAAATSDGLPCKSPRSIREGSFFGGLSSFRFTPDVRALWSRTKTMNERDGEGDGVNAYTSYRVTTKSPASDGEVYVIRRFSDFEWLHDRLGDLYRGAIVPPLPDKNVVEKFRFSREFVESRRRGLETFVRRVARHPVLGGAEELQHFLKDSEDRWTMEMRKTSESKLLGAKPSDFLSLFSSVQTTLASAVLGREEAAEEAETERMRRYADALEKALSDCHRDALQFVKKQREEAETERMRRYADALEKALSDCHRDALQLVKKQRGCAGHAGVRGMLVCRACWCAGHAGVPGMLVCGACWCAGHAGVRGMLVCGACWCAGHAGVRGMLVCGACWCAGHAGVRGMLVCGACWCAGHAGVRGMLVCGACWCAGHAGVRGMLVCGACWCAGHAGVRGMLVCGACWCAGHAGVRGMLVCGACWCAGHAGVRGMLVCGACWCAGHAGVRGMLVCGACWCAGHAGVRGMLVCGACWCAGHAGVRGMLVCGACWCAGHAGVRGMLVCGACWCAVQLGRRSGDGVELGASMCEFGKTLQSLGQWEEGPLGKCFREVGNKADIVGSATRNNAQVFLENLEEPLKEYVRFVSSLKKAISDRSLAWRNLNQLEADLKAKKGKL